MKILNMLLGPGNCTYCARIPTRPGIASSESSRVTRLSEPRDDCGSPPHGYLIQIQCQLTKSKILNTVLFYFAVLGYLNLELGYLNLEATVGAHPMDI